MGNHWTLGRLNGKEYKGEVKLSVEGGIALLVAGQDIPLAHVLTLNRRELTADKDALLRLVDGDARQPPAGMGSVAWRKQTAQAAANARHNQPGGSRAALLQIINIYSPKSTYDSIYLSNYATINIIDTLARINGVGQASLFGPLDYSLRVWLDPVRLTELNLTPNDVIAAVQSQNIQAALGRVGAAPITNEQQLQLTIKTTGRLTRPEEFAAI